MIHLVSRQMMAKTRGNREARPTGNMTKRVGMEVSQTSEVGFLTVILIETRLLVMVVVVVEVGTLLLQEWESSILTSLIRREMATRATGKSLTKTMTTDNTTGHRSSLIESLTTASITSLSLKIGRVVREVVLTNKRAIRSLVVEVEVRARQAGTVHG